MLTPEQRQLRKRFLGASEMPAILGVDPYRTASDVYMVKTGQAEDFQGNDATDRGELLEPVLLKYAEKRLRKLLIRDVMKADGDFLCANMDAIVEGEEQPVEAKTTVLCDEWGEDGTDQVPERVIVQVHQQMYLIGPHSRIAWVPVLMPVAAAWGGKLEFRLYCIHRNDELAARIAGEGVRFMREHVRKRVPPADFFPSLEVLKRVKRVPKKSVEIDPGLVDSVILHREMHREIVRRTEEAERKLLEALADAEAGSCEGTQIVTYMEHHRRAFEVKETTYRKWKFPGSKKSKQKRVLEAAPDEDPAMAALIAPNP